MSCMELSTDKHLVGPFVFGEVNATWGPEGREAIGLVKDGVVLAGVVLENFTGRSAMCHIAIAHPRVPVRKLVVAVANYAFNQLGVEKLIGPVPSTNMQAIQFDLRLGFQPEAIIRDAVPGGDMLIFSMTREQCKFLPRLKEVA